MKKTVAIIVDEGNGYSVSYSIEDDGSETKYTNSIDKALKIAKFVLEGEEVEKKKTK
jgi:hypothetical protein